MANINGTGGDENLIGTPESDQIVGNLGNDTLTGNGGSDTFMFNSIIDVVEFGGFFVYSTDGFDTMKDFSYDDSIINVNQGNHYPYHVSINGLVAPSAGPDDSTETKEIFGTIGADTIDGTSVDENIRSFSGNDKLYGNDGNDKLYGETGDDSLYGLAGRDKLYGSQGNDYLNGGEHDDELYGGAGNDTLDGESYHDLLIGGIGNDVYILNDNADKIREYLNEGTDTVKSSISYKLGDNLENLSVTGSSDIIGIELTVMLSTTF